VVKNRYDVEMVFQWFLLTRDPDPDPEFIHVTVIAVVDVAVSKDWRMLLGKHVTAKHDFVDVVSVRGISGEKVGRK
jgi:hypothetical protein